MDILAHHTQIHTTKMNLPLTLALVLVLVIIAAVAWSKKNEG